MYKGYSGEKYHLLIEGLQTDKKHTIFCESKVFSASGANTIYFETTRKKRFLISKYNRIVIYGRDVRSRSVQLL
jgi:hypothetical protein